MGKAVSNIVGSVANIFTGADSTREAGSAAAGQMTQAAKDAAAAAQFRPVGMTTRFGSSQFTREIDPATGMPYVSGASYTVSPELKSIQDKLFSQMGAFDTSRLMQAAEPLYSGAGQTFGAGSTLFGLGSQYLSSSPEQARQEYMATQQAALAPAREQQLSALRNQVFQTGRAGLATGGTSTGMMQSNPEMAAYYNAIAQQDLNLATQAEQAAQQRQSFGAGLTTQGAGMFNAGGALLGQLPTLQTAAYNPLQTQLGLASSVEQMGQMPFQLGVQLGQAQVPGQTAGAGIYNQGLSNAAQTQYGATQAANAANAGFWGGLMQAGGTALGGWLSKK